MSKHKVSLCIGRVYEVSSSRPDLSHFYLSILDTSNNTVFYLVFQDDNKAYMVKSSFIDFIYLFLFTKSTYKLSNTDEFIDDVNIDNFDILLDVPPFVNL